MSTDFLLTTLLVFLSRAEKWKQTTIYFAFHLSQLLLNLEFKNIFLNNQSPYGPLIILDRILLVGSKIWSHFERHPQLGFSSSQIICLPSNSVWSQKCMRHANAFIKWLFLAPLLAKTSRKRYRKNMHSKPH